MKFYKKYPRAELHQEVEPSIVKFRHLEPCSQCGDLTEYRHLDFDMPICSYKCVKILLKKYDEAERGIHYVK